MTSLNWPVVTASTKTYMTFTIDDELPSAFITSLTNSASEINLPAGHYFAQAYADYSRSSVNFKGQFSWYLTMGAQAMILWRIRLILIVISV